MEELEDKLDPRGVFKSAETGKNSYNSMRNLLGKELKTYRDATKGTDVYRGQGGGKSLVGSPKTLNVQLPDGSVRSFSRSGALKLVKDHPEDHSIVGNYG